MACQALDNPAHFQIPNDDLRVLSSAGDEPVALAHVDVGDEVQVAVQACLQRQRVPVPHLDYPAHNQSNIV